MKKPFFILLFFLAVRLFSFTFVVLGDSRGKKEQISPVFERIVYEIRLISPDFVVHTGDWSKSFSKNNLENFLKIMNKAEVPYYLTIGNHDVKGNWNDWTSVYKKLVKKPLYYSFKYQNSTFIILCCYIEKNGKTVWHKIGKRQFLWLKRTLQKSKNSDHIFIFVHEPLFPVNGHIGSSLDYYPEEKGKLLSILKPYKSKTIIFCGHEHLYSAVKKEGIFQIITGGAGAPLYTPPAKGGFHHYIVVKVKGKKLNMYIVKPGNISEMKY